MKNIFVGGIVVLGLVLLLWLASKYMGDAKEDKDSGCIKVNRDKFTIPFDDSSIPGGTIGQIAKTIFGSDDPSYGNIVSGFFKGIDVYPSEGAGKYYKKQIKAYYNSPNGLPRWQVAAGELACDQKL